MCLVRRALPFRHLRSPSCLRYPVRHGLGGVGNPTLAYLSRGEAQRVRDERDSAGGMEEELRRLIAAGEGAQLEFKSSFRHDFKTGNVNKQLTKAVARTIAGFLNTNGGTLLIGVADDGEIIGLERDIASLPRHKNNDGFEIMLRNAFRLHLGVEISPEIAVAFVPIDDKFVARVHCKKHSNPVYLQDGDKPEFYVRDGNATQLLDVRAAYRYSRKHFSSDVPVTRSDVRDIVRDELRQEGATVRRRPKEERCVSRTRVAGRRLMEFFRKPRNLEITPATSRDIVQELRQQDAVVTQPPPTPDVDQPPPWLEVTSRRVIDLFLRTLARSVGWKRIYIVSPWISAINASITFDSLLDRLKEDGTTVYLVTRPPVLSWHEEAIARLGETGRANIALVPNLHAKLYTASTSNGSFALIGSANFTQKSLVGYEIGVLINAFSDGKRVVAELNYEAAQIYRTPGRQLLYKAIFT